MHQNIKCYCFILILFFCTGARAESPCLQWLAEVISMQGKVDAQVAGNLVWQAVRADQKFCDGDKIRTGKHSRVTLLFRNESRATLDQNSTLVFLSPQQKTMSWYLELLKGSSFFRSRETQRLRIETPFINAVHQGTEFLVKVDTVHAAISVFDGVVAASNNKGEIRINKGSIGIAEKDYPPRVEALTIRPEDAVQWTLYYPPIVDYQSIESTKTDDLSAAINAYQQGNTYQALSLLDQIPLSQQDKSYLVLKSSLLLTSGSVDEAKKQIEKILAMDAANSTAFALQSIIAVAKNRQDKAYDLAQKAVELNPQSAVAQIALSYAYQSQFKIELALKATQEAIRLSPDNALAWARLAELQLSTGERSDAMESAKKAQTLNPQLERTQTVLGFAYLAQIEIDEAKAAFTEAIHLNSADPLARLGLGLAKIRKGDIEEGTHDLETAVSLDPDNSIMRSYLGKAYYELKKDGYAATELTIAKEMDSKDPTPWFYDAIRKQTTNRPVEALHDIQKAIELNDNRGVYRSKLLLDEDLAARSASLGRIYNDLGFQRLGLIEGWKSVNTDPKNYSAHRLLADSYASRSRHEIARVSELLQSQLLQPINVNPIQPRLAESDLLTLNGLGPGDISFNEFNPLFTRNRLALQASGLYGSNNTWGEEVVQSGLWNNFSYSLGQFHYETDGFRKNNDLERDVYNIFIQGALTSKLNLQAEYRRSERKNGDLHQYFNSNDFDKNKRRDIEEDIARVGLRYSISPESTLIFSGIHSDFHEKGKSAPPITTQLDLESYQMETQFLFQHNLLNIAAGIGSYRLKGNDIFNVPGFVDISQFIDEHYNAYIYTNWHPINSINGTIGFSYDSVDISDNPMIEKLNPKLGLQWQINKFLQLRLAYFQAVKRSLITNQTIELTQIAGFNQFYDDLNGTRSEQYSIGLDTNITDNLRAGLEYSRRELQLTSFELNNQTQSLDDITSQRREELIHGYLYWTPHPLWAISLETEYEEFRRSVRDPFVVRGNQPAKVSTFTFPMGIRYFQPSGFFAGIEGVFVHQEVENLPTTTSTTNQEDFYLVNAKLGYRFPKRFGTISLEARNLFDTDFNYEDSDIQTQREESNPRFIPGVAVFLNLSVAF